jgi:hypothetical protein
MSPQLGASLAVSADVLAADLDDGKNQSRKRANLPKAATTILRVCWTEVTFAVL